MSGELIEITETVGVAESDGSVTVELFVFREGSTQGKVFQLLSDKLWHCREHEGKAIASGQYAGGGGIQGLQRGTKERPGLVIEQKNEFCFVCNKSTRWDRWTGEIKEATATAAIPPKLIARILAEYQYTDVIEQRVRARHELVIDHRFPMERWGQNEPPNPSDMSSRDLRKKFQLLKKDAAGNHNLLKSRACERCIVSNKRGTPFGIQFWYEGDENWTAAPRGPEAEAGCVGCGWYDFAIWRTKLNQKLKLSLPVLEEGE